MRTVRTVRTHVYARRAYARACSHVYTHVVSVRTHGTHVHTNAKNVRTQAHAHAFARAYECVRTQYFPYEPSFWISRSIFCGTFQPKRWNSTVSMISSSVYKNQFI